MPPRILRHVLGAFLTIGLVVCAADVAAAAPTRRTTGLPTSSNGASSMHTWLDSTPRDRMEATITIVKQPSVPALHFWALQVSFVDAAGAVVGGAHIGLQWHPSHPSSTAVNFGGYRTDGKTLSGSSSKLRSATANANTRDFPWKAGAAYRLSIAKSAHGWTGAVTDVATGAVVEVRTLYVDAAAISSALVFSEVFAACDAPRTEVEWAGLPLPATATYQSVESGGCTNTNQAVLHGTIVQRTNATRTVLDQARLLLLAA